MSDFGELCPLFNTGVCNEITFPAIDMIAISASGNAIYGTKWPSITMIGYFTFGRTVVVTGAFVRRTSANSVEVNLYLRHHSAAIGAVSGVAGTVFGSATITPTISILDNYAYKPFTVTETTFTSTDVLGLAPSLGAAGSMGTYDLIVRYRDK
jgi:hypothetical protein